MKNISLAQLRVSKFEYQRKKDAMSVYKVHNKFLYKQTVFVNLRSKKFKINEEQTKLILSNHSN